MHKDVSSPKFHNRINWEVILDLEKFRHIETGYAMHYYSTRTNFDYPLETDNSIKFTPYKSLRRNISRSLPKIENDFSSFPVYQLQLSKTPSTRPKKSILRKQQSDIGPNKPSIANLSEKLIVTDHKMRNFNSKPSKSFSSSQLQLLQSGQMKNRKYEKSEVQISSENSDHPSYKLTLSAQKSSDSAIEKSSKIRE